jgi:hypothetical protein
VTVIAADGKVVYDTSVPDIAENLNTRISVITAQLGHQGVGWEKKFDSVVGRTEQDLARRQDMPQRGFHEGPYVVRLGRFFDNAPLCQ